MLNPYQKNTIRGRLNKHFSDDRPKVDIEEVFEKLVGFEYHRSGGRAILTLCPFHGERHPSFAIYPDTNSYHCFACGESGDVFTLVMKLKEVDFKEALVILRNL